MRHIAFNRNELAGSMGDIGIFLPLALSLITFNGLNPFSVFFMGGALYITSGLYFKHPVPVQPLKALAVTSLAIGASTSMISAASIMIGIALLVIYLTDISGSLKKIFSRPIVRGIQFGLGLILINKGVDYLRLKEFIFNGGERLIHLGNHTIPLGLLIGGASVFFAIKFFNNKKIPSSIIILGSGLILGIVIAPEGFLSNGRINPAVVPAVGFPDLKDFIPALFLLVIPQIPLTIGNSLFASSDTAKNYFAEKAVKTTPGRLSLNLGIANIIIGIFGGMPLCHGAGGLTAHYRFGARSVGSNIIIGTIFIAIAIASLFFTISYLYLIPGSILGGLLMFTGLEHAMLIGDIANNRYELLITLTIGSIAVITGNLFMGVCFGLLVKVWLYSVRGTDGIARES